MIQKLRHAQRRGRWGGEKGLAGEAQQKRQWKEGWNMRRGGLGEHSKRDSGKMCERGGEGGGRGAEACADRVSKTMKERVQ